MTARLSVIIISAVLGYREWLDRYAIIVSVSIESGPNGKACYDNEK